MVVKFMNQDVDVRIISMDTTKSRYGAYLHVETFFEFEYETPSNTTPFEFENWLHDNHIDELVEIYQDEQ